MGRSVLILVILMSTLFAGIVINLQEKMLNLPDVMVRNMLWKEAESVSDYALRTGIRNAGSMGFSAPIEGYYNFTQYFDDFTIGHCTIDSIRYSFVESADHYRAQTTVRASLHGINLTYPAEMAFNYPITAIVGTPNCFYFEMDQPQFHGSNEWIRDTSGNGYTGQPYNAVSTRPHGSGANGWKCASFDGTDDYIDIRCEPGCTEHPALILTDEVTLVSFAKIRTDTNSNQGTIVWVSSDPYDTSSSNGAHPGNNLRVKPTAAIWYNSTNSSVHFAVTLNNGPKTYVEAIVPYTPLGKWPHNKDPWHHFGLTYNGWTLKAYINGIKKATVFAPSFAGVIPNRYGISVGRRDLRTVGTTNSEYKYFKGLLDQVGMYNRALTEAEMYAFYIGVIRPENILYIRD